MSKAFEKSEGSSWSKLSFSPPPPISLSPKRKEKKKMEKKSKISFAKPLLLLTCTHNRRLHVIISVCSLF